MNRPISMITDLRRDGSALQILDDHGASTEGDDG